LPPLGVVRGGHGPWPCSWGTTGSLFFLNPQMFAQKIQVVLQRQRAWRRRPSGMGDRAAENVTGAGEGYRRREVVMAP
jgi:hypothetical protein